MTDEYINELTATTTLADADLLVAETAVATTPETKYITWANFKALLRAVLTDINGWIPVTATWTRTGDHTFTVTGDVTASYRKGAKIRYKDVGAYDYGVIKSSSYSAPNTTVNLIPNTSYVMTGGSITDRYISYIENPEGFPASFAWSPAYTNVTTTDGTLTARWTVEAGKFKFFANLGFGASTAITGDPTITIPVTMATYGGVASPVGHASFIDSGSTVYAGTTVYVTSTTVKAIAYNAAGTYATIVNVSSTVPFTWGSGDTLQMEGEVIW